VHGLLGETLVFARVRIVPERLTPLNPARLALQRRGVCRGRGLLIVAPWMHCWWRPSATTSGGLRSRRHERN